MKDELILNNLNLIYVVLKQMELYSQHEYYYDIGLLGLVKAANIYDESKGYMFTTVASTCIRNEILIDIRNRKSNKRRANYDAISLDTAICTDADGKELTLMDLIPSDFDIEEYVIHRDEIRQLRRAIAKLKQSDKELLKLYYGPNKITQEEIAKMYHTTQSAISRKIVRAINKLRKLMDVKVKGDKNGCNGDNEGSNNNTR